jgi:hypothetical protein
MTMTSQMTFMCRADAESRLTLQREGEQPVAQRRRYRAPALAKGPRLSDVTADTIVSGAPV